MNARLCIACQRPLYALPWAVRPHVLCPTCLLSAVALAFYVRSKSTPTTLSACVVCRLPMSRRPGALTCSPPCRHLLSDAHFHLGDDDVSEPDALSSPAPFSPQVGMSFDLDNACSDSSFARSLVPGVRWPTRAQLVAAVFDHPLFASALARFADSKSVARDDLLAFFVAAGGTSRAAAQSLASTYASLRALLLWLVPELADSVPIIADVPSVFVLPRHTGFPRTTPSPLCLYCGESPPAGGRELCEECEPFVALVLRERQMRIVADLPCAPQLGCLICAGPLPRNCVISCSRESCRMALKRVSGRASNHAGVLRGSIPRFAPGTSLVFGDPPPGLARVAHLRAAALSTAVAWHVTSQPAPSDVPPELLPSDVSLEFLGSVPPRRTHLPSDVSLDLPSDVSLELLGSVPPGHTHVPAVPDAALAALRGDAAELSAPEPLVPCLACARPFQRPAPQYRSLFLCSTCVVRVVATAISADADSSHSPRSSCVVCLAAMSRRATDLTCSDRCRALLYRARQRVASLAVSSSGFSPDVELFVPDVFSPPQHDDAHVSAEPRFPFDDALERPGPTGVAPTGAAPAGADAPGVRALRDAVAACAAAGVAADARRQVTEAACSALVEGAAAAVADCARAFADAGCTVEPERYRSVARAGFDVDGFRARFAAVPVAVRVVPLGGLCTVHGVRAPLVQRFALYRAELRAGADFDTWAWHVEVDRTTGSACVIVLRNFSRRVLCTPESAFAERCAFARELDALAAGFARRVTALHPRARGGDGGCG